jgi:hypothetical protein
VLGVVLLDGVVFAPLVEDLHGANARSRHRDHRPLGVLAEPEDDGLLGLEDLVDRYVHLRPLERSLDGVAETHDPMHRVQVIDRSESASGDAQIDPIASSSIGLEDVVVVMHEIAALDELKRCA